MSDREEKLERMLSAFERDWAPSASNLRTMLEANPALRTRMLDAAETDRLLSFKGVDPTDRSQGMLGGYNPNDGSLALPMDLLGNAPRNRANAGTVLMTIGHEVEHAVHRDDIRTTNQHFATGVQRIAESPGPHDYTALLGQRGNEQRLREANDEIAGINTLAAQVRTANPNAGLKDLFDAAPVDMAQYIDVAGTPPRQTYTPREGLSFGQDLRVEPNAANLEAMGKLFYDANHYPANYGSRALYQIEQAEAAAASRRPAGEPAPEVRVDMKALGLDQARANGDVYFPTGFTDTSAPRLGPPAPTDPAMPDASASRPQAAWSHPLYQQALAGLEQLPAEHAIVDRGARHRTAGAMAAQAQADGLQRIDAVLGSHDGQRLFSVQGQVGAPDAWRSHVDRTTAQQQPLEASASQLQQESARAATQEQEAQRTPVMR
ncbi:hypothetical protein FZ025_01505 [Xanthomonas hyacinthi]|nr:XVIPCD domain-containing protein [Xanthomonas hyacinthi]QGY75406.1 hypothetical protein FZ025_01505 [Xanthomonas hyacinthi]